MELRVVGVRLFELGLEEDHDTILKEVVVLHWVRVHPLRLEVVQPRRGALVNLIMAT